MALPTRPKETTNGYLAFNDNNKESIITSHGSVIESYDGVRRPSEKATAIELTNDHHIRSPFNRYDYEKMRPNERMPTRFREVVHACRSVYLRLGVCRNVIDMMTDFATEDLRIVHPDKKQEAFFKVWMSKVKLKDAVDEFVRHFLVDGNVVVKRITAKLPKPTENQWRTQAAEPEKIYVEDTTSKREIPWKYTFLNVAALEWVGGDITKISGERQLGFYPSSKLRKTLNDANDPFQKNAIDKMPLEIKDALKRNDSGMVLLDMDKLYVAHNKKDSWEDWAPPFLYSVLQDVGFRDKLRQAEISALDGVINVIRLWKLGDHKEGILPNSAVINKLVGILDTNTGGGAIDIVWDSMIDMKEYYPPIDQILGSEKYDQVNRDILIGLGVPEVLIGGEGGNFSNSFIQLKTLVEKLEYVRNRVIEWLTEEVRVVCEAMGIVVPPKVKFKKMSLEDEETTKQLIVNLLDRGIISAEAVLDIYGEDFMLEMDRIKAQKDIFQKSGVKIKSPLDPKPVAKGTKAPGGKTGQVGKGRPPTKKSSPAKKERTPKPRRTKGNIELGVYAFEAISAIDTHVIPTYMESVGVNNARKLTSDQKEDIDNLRTLVLASLKPGDDLSDENILFVAENVDQFNKELLNSINKAVSGYISQNGVEPTLNQRKNIEAIAWADYYIGLEN